MVGRTLHERVESRPSDFLGTIANGDGLHNLVELAVEAALGVSADRTVRVVLFEEGSVGVFDDGPPLLPEADGWCGGRAPTRREAPPTPEGWIPGHALLVAGCAVVHVHAADGRSARYEAGACVWTGEQAQGPGRNEVRFRAGAWAGESPDLDSARLRTRLRDLAALSSGSTLHFEDRIQGLSASWRFERGCADLLAYFDGHRRLLHPAPVVVEGAGWSMALRWCKGGGTEVVGFVNRRRVSTGAHLMAGLGALSHVVDSYARRVKRWPLAGLKWPPHASLGEHLTLLIHVVLEAPEFGQHGEALLANVGLARIEQEASVALAHALDGTTGVPALGSLLERYLVRIEAAQRR